MHTKNHDDHWECVTCESGTSYRLNAWNSDAYGDNPHGQCVTAYVETEAGLDTSRWKCLIEKSAIGAECLIRNCDDGEADTRNVYISFGAYTEHHQHDGFGVHDDFIYYYADNGENELKELMTPSAADFVVISYELVYEQPTKTLYSNNGHATPKSQFNYKVLMSRSASESCEVQVFAEDEASAREQALEIIESDDFEPDNWKLDDEIGTLTHIVAS